MRSLLRAAGAVALSLCLAASQPAAGPSSLPAAARWVAPATRPNIVFILADDLSVDLLQFMPNVRRLAADGTSFANYVVTDTLCCPSRSSIFTGKFPHNTGVFTNSAPDGGWAVFRKRGNESDTFGTSLRRAGYRTAMLGKYMNGYSPASGHVPPGWDQWAVGGDAYRQYDYTLNENGVVRKYGQEYLTHVLTGKATAFIEMSAGDRTPFFVEIATFAPHSPFTPAPQDTGAFPGLRAPRGPAFDRLPIDAPPWLADRPPLGPDQLARIDDAYRRRAQSVLSLDRMIGTLRETLTRTGTADDTVLVFSSDNGFHLGEHRLTVGKQTAFETDVRVPLIVAGPGVRAGATVTETAENVDLRPTFDDLVGTPSPPDVDGRSLAPLLRSGMVVSGTPVSGWRTAALVEHRRPEFRPDDPDRQKVIPESYAALRTPEWTYVRYASGALEFYDRRTDPHQLRNVAPALSPARKAALAAALDALVACKGAVACEKAGIVRA
ncbi:sulfatase family protein [Catenuloplanes japonicus]|uniref:sulfatase family protein n=1 Tax=Catenuloplanes japonicus TaxID=33876 RepID=UPI000B30FB07|nr:sulfatase [Catenuloplanes japonicus]